MRSDVVGITCPRCGCPGTAPKKLLGSGTEIKHSVTQGGCGGKFKV